MPGATTVSSRPSTGGSAQPLYPVPSHQPTGYFQQQQQQPNDLGRSTSAANTVYTHSHSHSSISYTSPPVSNAHWNGAAGVGYNGDSLGMAPLQPPTSDPYPDRSGSPTSIQETRRLQVANAIPVSAGPEDFQGASSSSAAAPVVTDPPQPQRDGKGRLRTSVDEPSSSAAPPPAYHE
ncbi:hypothetical protein DXG03_008829 [Asterophora parasitica]|uniref:Uncharacterized protein n=1 Tax=Asterophora parasitica TaxID=117018 RepID=A0A9P7KCK1_9AGAR|nr:hypothetical protein DXG03_008829 [Asterophora parasitica]